VKCSVSPLKIGGDSAAILYELATHNLPLGVAPMPLAGGTSPVTPASTILIANAANDKENSQGHGKQNSQSCARRGGLPSPHGGMELFSKIVVTSCF